MRMLAIISGEYGRRHVENLRAHGPADWEIMTWQAPAAFPLVIDYPEDHLPAGLPPADLILAFGEHKAIAELLPDIAKATGAQAVLAPVDNENWLPRGLARQLRGWLADIGVACATPKPLCALTETHYGARRREWAAYDSPHIAEFARCFGKPELDLTIDAATRTITAAGVKRDAVCGCARHVAERLIGIGVDDAGQEAGLLHHHYPCLASMGIDPDYGDTLLHISGNLLKDDVNEQVKPYRQIHYLTPGKRADEKW
ncbi:MAG: hypothetical protein JXB47_15450 [Anaerolineae bacterium]|nr:hypothetical protein [Anaerolineae bacterium]